MQTTDTLHMLRDSNFDPFYESDLDEENHLGSEKPGLLEKRRKLHTEAEQRRRNAIKRGYEVLAEVVQPPNNDSIRMNKLTILQQSSSTIERLIKQRKQMTLDIDHLSKKVKTLHIMKSIYEKVFHEQSKPQKISAQPISEEFKRHIFQLFTDEVFRTFDSSIEISSFVELSGCAINWLENNCQSVQLSNIMDIVLTSAFDTACSRNLEDYSDPRADFEDFPKTESSQSLFTSGFNAERTNNESGPQSILTNSSTTAHFIKSKLRSVVNSNASRPTSGFITISNRRTDMDTSYPTTVPSTLPSSNVSPTSIVNQSPPNKIVVSHSLINRNPKQFDFRAGRGRGCDFGRSWSLSTTQPSLSTGSHTIEPMRVDQSQSDTLVSVMSATDLCSSMVDSHDSIRLRQPFPPDVRQRPCVCAHLKIP